MIVRGVVRALLGEQTQSEPFPRFAFAEQPDRVEQTDEISALMIEVRAAIDAVLERREVPQEIRDTLEFIAVSKMDDVLLHALETPVVQDETAPAAVPAARRKGQGGGGRR